MSASIYRISGDLRIRVATFPDTNDALRCFKEMAYRLGERLVMTTNGSDKITVHPPRGCHLNGNGEYVINPVFREDCFR